jgi:hypothetical protein
MVMYRGRGRRHGYGRPGRRVRGYYRARSRTPGPIPGCLLPLALVIAVGIRRAQRSRNPWVAGPLWDSPPRHSLPRMGSPSRNDRPGDVMLLGHDRRRAGSVSARWRATASGPGRA